MSSPAWLTQDGQTSTSGITSQPQISESPVRGTVSGPPASVTASSTLVSSADGSTTNPVTTVASTPTSDSSLPTAASVPATPAANSPTPRGPHGTANDPLQDPVRAKFVSSPGYIIPAPSFSYSVFPRVNSASGSPQQSLSTPALKLTPPMPAAALQPPVPGNRPSFSYNVVSHANSSSASGQQFQPATTTNQVQMLGGKFAPPQTAASLQPPVPGQSVRPNSTVPGTVVQNVPPPIPMPFSIPKGLPPSANFCFSGSPQLGTLEAPEKNASSNMDTSAPVAPGAGAASAALVSSQPIQLSTNLPTSTSMALAPSPNLNSSSMLMSTNPSFSGRPVLPGIVGTLGLPRIPNSATFSSTVAIQPTFTDSSSSTLRPVVPSPASVPTNLVSVPVQAPHNVQQQIFPPYPSLPSMPPPPQALWLNPPQAGGFQRAPFVPYPGVLPAPFPFLVRGMPLPSVPFPNVQPPGVSTVVANEATVSITTGSCQPGNNSGSGSPPPGIDNDKQATNLPKDGVTKNEEVDAWTAHKTESGAIYYYNSITRESTYEKPSSFKGEPEKVTVQSTPVSWEKLAGTNWTLVTTNDGNKYYYDDKNKVSSWQVPAEVTEMRKNQDNDPLKENATQVENTSALADKGSAPSSISAPAVHTGGRESTSLRTSGAPVSSSTLDLVKKKLQDAGTPVTSSPLPASSVPAMSDINGSKVAETAVKGQQIMNSKDKVKDANEDGNMSDSSSDSEDVESGPTKEECIIQFKEMLKERGVAPFSKWEKELPKIVFDPRFKAVPGYSTRRSLFEHYVRTRAEEERKEKRAAQKAAVDGFKQLLEEASEDIDCKTDYQSFKRKWGGDPRFEALDRKERELLLNEKVLPIKKAFEEKIQAIRMTSVTHFKSMLRENSDITTSSRWSKVKDRLRNDPRYKSVKHEDRELLFNEYISELKAAEDEEERVAKAKREEQEKLKERERELRKRKEREEQEMERIRLKVRRKEAISSYQALLVETIKDPKASWTESKPKLEKDPQGRATNPDLSQADMEKQFRDHVKDLYERCARDFRSLLAEAITVEAAAQTTDDGKNVLNSWSEAKRLLKHDARYAKMPRKERESLWGRYAEDIMRKQKAASDPKEKLDTDGRNRTSSADPSRRSHGRR